MFEHFESLPIMKTRGGLIINLNKVSYIQPCGENDIAEMQGMYSLQCDAADSGTAITEEDYQDICHALFKGEPDHA